MIFAHDESTFFVPYFICEKNIQHVYSIFLANMKAKRKRFIVFFLFKALNCRKHPKFAQKVVRQFVIRSCTKSSFQLLGKTFCWAWFTVALSRIFIFMFWHISFGIQFRNQLENDDTCGTFSFRWMRAYQIFYQIPRYIYICLPSAVTEYQLNFFLAAAPLCRVLGISLGKSFSDLLICKSLCWKSQNTAALVFYHKQWCHG